MRLFDDQAKLTRKMKVSKAAHASRKQAKERKSLPLQNPPYSPRQISRCLRFLNLSVIAGAFNI